MGWVQEGVEGKEGEEGTMGHLALLHLCRREEEKGR